MSNAFKTKSRFSSLIEENENNKEENTEQLTKRFKNVSDKKREEYNYDKRENTSYAKFKDDKEKKIKEEQQKLIMDNNNFPTLTNEKINKNLSETLNFIDKVKTVVKCDEEDFTNEEYVPPGYLFMKRDKNTNKIIRKYGEMSIYKEEKEIFNPNKIMDKLVYLYEKRKEEYIDLWGEEEYERMFLFNNYDYYYFDKLDLQYEEEMKKMNNKEIDRFDSDYYDDYYMNNKYDD
jgi:hypothetical protein